jgi:hypothetical protein
MEGTGPASYATFDGAGMSTTLYYDRLHRAIWELYKRNPDRQGAIRLKDAWQSYVVDRRPVLSKVPSVWDKLLNDYWNGYAREYGYAPRKPPSPLTPAEVRPPGGYVERATQQVIEKAQAAASKAGEDFSKDAEVRLRLLAEDATREAQQSAEAVVRQAQRGTGTLLLGGALLAGLLMLVRGRR